jgi:hypothetical protein
MEPGISVSAKRWAVALGLVVVLLVVASVAASFLSLVPIHNHLLRKIGDTIVRLTWVDGECNIPAWFSASLLLVCALLLAVIAAAQGGDEPPDRRWLVLALIFGFLSLDETAQLHELSIAPLRDMLHPSGLLYYAWIIPAGIAVALFAVAYLSFLQKLPARTRRLFLSAAAVYVGGALGVEAISGTQAALHGEHSVAYHAIVTVEETMEMAGLVYFIYALLDYISVRFTTVRFHVVSR